MFFKKCKVYELEWPCEASGGRAESDVVGLMGRSRPRRLTHPTIPFGLSEGHHPPSFRFLPAIFLAETNVTAGGFRCQQLAKLVKLNC